MYIAFVILLCTAVLAVLTYAARLEERRNIQVLDDGSIVRLPAKRGLADGGSGDGGGNGGCGGDGGGSCG